MAPEQGMRKHASRQVSVRSLRDAGGPDHGERVVEAHTDELAGIARRLDVPSITMFRCSFNFEQPDPDGAVLAHGILDATLERICVVSLEPFEQTVNESFSVRFVPERDRVPDGEPAAEMLDPEDVDEVFYSGGTIDLGEAAVEQLALCLDPYPRRPDLEPDLDIDTVTERETGDEPPHPFAKLAQLKQVNRTRH